MKKSELGAGGEGRRGLIEEGEAFRRLSAAVAPGAAVALSAPARSARSARTGRTFHAGMSIAFLVTAVAGFAPTYYFKGFSHAPPLSPLLHVHAVVFTAWLLLLVTQSALVAAHRVDLHRRLGIAGAMLAVTMVPVGIMTAVDAARRGVTRPGVDPRAFLMLPVGALVLFAFFIGAALWKRRRPESHRRLILLATVSIMTPAIARLPFVGMRPVVSLAVSALFILAGIIHDLKSRGRVNPIYLWGGLVILLSGPLRFSLGQTAAWQSFAQFLIE